MFEQLGHRHSHYRAFRRVSYVGVCIEMAAYERRLGGNLEHLGAMDVQKLFWIFERYL